MAKAARQAGLTAQVEQNMYISDQPQEDGLPAQGSVWPIHKADVLIVEPAAQSSGWMFGCTPFHWTLTFAGTFSENDT